MQSDSVRDYLTHLAVRRQVSASTQNQAFSALLFLCREVPGLDMEGVYGGGLRVRECCQLRVKDLDFDQGLIFVRGGKGAKDRATLPGETARE